LEEALKKYDMGDAATIKDIIAEVDTDHVSNSKKPKIISLAIVSYITVLIFETFGMFKEIFF
jgi:hypothetical protein